MCTALAVTITKYQLISICLKARSRGLFFKQTIVIPQNSALNKLR